MSTVYVLTNDSMPGLVKLGRTSGSIEKRMRDLYKTGVPIPFNCFYAVNVKDSDFVERKIHEAFDDVRLNESREFFSISPEKYKLPVQKISASLFFLPIFLKATSIESSVIA